jgi:peptidoglycan/LPS O-acetylase OafA/YrhL
MVWIVAAAVVGGVAGVLWVLRSEIGGAHTGTPVVVGSVVLTLLAAALLYHGIMVAAREQDRRSDLVAQRRQGSPATRNGARSGAGSGAGSARPAPRAAARPQADEDEPLTFRRGKQI